MHAVSLTPHAKYSTACTIDELFERPWQPLKGISIKNIHVRKLSYPISITTKLYKFKGDHLLKNFVHAVRMNKNRRLQSLISSRIRSRIQKGFSL
jgi:hypothetical protein